MPEERSEIISLLKNVHLFRALKDPQLEELADLCSTVYVTEGQVLFLEGAPADSFYIILDGKMKVTKARGQKETVVATLVTGDYFGEEGLLRNRTRSAALTSLTDSTLLRMDKRTFDVLLKDIPRLKSNLEVIISSHHLSQRVRLNWLNEDEVVYLMARKHKVFLWLRLILPGLTTLIAAVLFIFFYLSGRLDVVWVLVLSTLFFVGGVGWIGWSALDWSNDYYIVTSQRVVWLERIAGLYDSRQEAPLYTLLSVGVNTDQAGRMLHFGDVIVRTFTGPIILRRVEHPEQIASLVEEHWFRSKSVSRKTEAAAMTKAIRQRLGLADPTAANQNGQKSSAVDIQVKPGFFQQLFANFFRVRYQEGGIVTYRKHWFILVRRTWKQVFWWVVALAFVVARATNYFTLLSMKSTIITAFFFSLIILGWYLYEYVDWRNDIYQVTAEQILDVNRKPLGKETKKSAPLESILSIEYERVGVIGLLLNFGTVYINVGGTKFTFNEVYDPSQVQQDVFRRMAERVTKKKDLELRAERERVSEWLATYHRSADELRREEQNPSDFDPFLR